MELVGAGEEREGAWWWGTWGENLPREGSPVEQVRLGHRGFTRLERLGSCSGGVARHLGKPSGSKCKDARRGGVGRPGPWLLWRIGIRMPGWGPGPKLTVPENSGTTGMRGPAKRTGFYPAFCPVHLVWLPSPGCGLSPPEKGSLLLQWLDG